MVKRKNIDIEHEFSTTLGKQSLQNCFIDLVKYMIYMRNQIPYPHLILEQTYGKDQHKWLNIDSSIVPHRTKAYKDWCKLSTFIKNFNLIYHDLASLIQSYNVQKVLVIIGSTVVSPTESIVINNYIRKNYPESTNNKALCRRLMMNLTMNDDINDLPKLSMKKVYILVKIDKAIPYSDESDIFLPKHNFKQPSRGVIHQINLKCKDVDNGSNKEETSEKNLSGDCTSTSFFGNCDRENWYLSKIVLNGFK